MSFPFWRRSSGLLAAATGVLCVLPSARAVPPETLAGLALHPIDPNMFVLRYESAGGGFLFTRDGGKTVSANPAHSFTKYGLTGQVPFAIGSDGKLLLGQIDGLYLDDGAGCVSSTVNTPAWVADFAPHPSDPDVLFFATTGNTMGVHAGLWKRDRTGSSSSFGASEPLVASGGSYAGLVVYGLKVVARSESLEGLRFVEVATRFVVQDGHMLPTPLLRFSDDYGASWTERTIHDANNNKGTPRLLAVGSGTPMKVVVALEVTGPDPEPIDPIFYSADEGQTFALYISEVTKAYASLLLPDGRLLVGERAQAGGLWLADALGATPHKVANHPVQCLGYHAKSQRVYMCKPYEFGVLDLATGSFCSQFQMNETVSLACATFGETELAAVRMQLCNGWCGAGHYASSQLCSRYDDPAQVCGVQARAYDVQNPDPDKRWLEPPGFSAAQRCSGSTVRPPPVATTPADAGALSAPFASADAAVGTRDASLSALPDSGSRQTNPATSSGSPGTQDGTASGSTEVETDPAETTDDGASGHDSRTRGGGGCQLPLRPGTMHGSLVAFLLSVLTALWRLRQRRAP